MRRNHPNAPRFVRQRRGITLIYAMFAMAALMGVVSLAVDLGRVTVAKTQLCRLADVAAMYGARGLGDGNAVVWTQSAAAEQVVDVWGPPPSHSTPFALQSGDVVTGNWSGTAFTAG